MKKRIISCIVFVSFILSMLNTSVYANFQIPVDDVNIDEVYFVEGQNVVTGEDIIRPTMTVSWEEPLQWGGLPADPDYHTPDFYDIIVDNLTTGEENTIRVNPGSDAFNNLELDIHEEIALDTGSLYNIIVRPQHYHVNEEGTAYVLAPESGIPEDAYAITDLEVDFISTEDSITVIWDDLGSDDFEYRIAYAIGDFTSSPRQDLLNNTEGDITGLRRTSPGVSSYYDAVEDRNKLSYTITENIYPGQVYSVMVEPLVEYYNSESVMRNRNYPYIRSTSTNVELELFEEGDYVRLEWDVPGSFRVGQDRDEYALVEATLVEIVDGQSSNVVIFDGDSAAIGYYKIPQPDQQVQYQIRFVYSAVDDQSKPDIEPISNLVTYVPSEVMITPTRPFIPSFFSQGILDDMLASMEPDDIRQSLEDKYLVPGDTYTGNLNDLIAQNITYHIVEDQNGINLTWGAFQRIDIDVDSDTYNEYIYDTNVYYDIWVTETMDALNYATPVIYEKNYGTLGNNQIEEDGEVIGFKELLTSYYNADTGELELLEPNSIYYIKIVAKKINANQTLTSEGNVVTLYYGYDGDAFEPPTIAKPPLEVLDEYTTETGVTINWKENWFEVLSPDAAVDTTLSVWRHQVWVQTDGTITDYYVDGAEYFPVYEGEAEAERLEQYLTDIGHPMNILVREVDLGEDSFGQSDVRYYFARIPYAEVQDAIEAGGVDYTFSDYYQDLIAADKNDSSPIDWVQIAPQPGATDDDLTYREENMLPNTSYLFMLYPYRLLYTGDELFAHYPTPIVVSTEPEEVVVVPDPIVPNLYVSNATDTSISVMWKYNDDFEYELMYSEYEDIDTATSVEWSLPESIFDPLYPVSGEYYEVDVEYLFPNTEYYFWIRAYQPTSNVYSHWSNAALGRTRDVDIPVPPRGLGIASEESMSDFGYDESVTDNYFAIEWILDPEDLLLMSDEEDNADVNKTYSYIVEIADNERFIDPVYIESSGGEYDIIPEDVEILDKNLVKVNNLIQNRGYYIRVKTRVTIVGDDEDQVIVKDSAYTNTIKIITVPTNDEYDGIYDPELDVLPEDDFEIIYNDNSQTLVYRFRDDEEGDNNVDQRLITELIEQNIYIYEVDVSTYGNKPIVERIIQVPYTIMNAFNDYKVDLKIDAGDMVLSIPYDAIKTELEYQANQYGVDPMVEISIKTVDELEEVAPISGMDAVTGQQDLSIHVKSSRTNQALNFADKALEMDLKTDNRYELYGQEIKTYVKDYKNDWVEVDAAFDSYNSQMTFETSRIGMYSAFVVNSSDETSVSQSVANHWSETYREAVSDVYSLQGLSPYDPNNRVSEQAMINIVYGMVNEDASIDVTGFIPSPVMNVLKQSGIKTDTSKSDPTISREEAISMMVKAYEIKYDQLIPYESSDLNAVRGNVSEAYAVNIAKAVTLGLVSDTGNIRAYDSITYGEMFKIWAVADKMM